VFSSSTRRKKKVQSSLVRAEGQTIQRRNRAAKWLKEVPVVKGKGEGLKFTRRIKRENMLQNEVC